MWPTSVTSAENCLATVHSLSKWGAVLNSCRRVDWLLMGAHSSSPVPHHLDHPPFRSPTAQPQFTGSCDRLSSERAQQLQLPWCPEHRMPFCLFGKWKRQNDPIARHSWPWRCSCPSCSHSKGLERLIDGLELMRLYCSPNSPLTRSKEKEASGG